MYENVIVLFAQSRAVLSFHTRFVLFCFALQLEASNDFLHSPKLWPSQGIPASEELFFSRKKAPRTLLQPSVELNSEHSALGAGEWGCQG